MHYIHNSLRLLSLFLFLCSAQAAPFTQLEPQKREDVPFRCSGDDMATFDSACWDILGLEDYLVRPETGWNHTIPICEDTRRCCRSEEPWSTCYVRLAVGNADYSCLSIDGEDCTWDKKISEHLDGSIRGKVKYITKSIFEIHNFFSKYFRALTDTVGSTMTIITSMTLAVDAQIKSNVLMQLVLSAFTLGLSFLVAPALGASAIEGIQSSVLKTQASVWSVSLSNAPGVAKTMWPQGDATSIQIQIGKLEESLDSATSQYQEILDRGLKQLMLEPETFAAFARGGGYCGNTSTDLVEQKETIDLALRTFLTSESMGQNGWYATAGDVVTEEEWEMWEVRDRLEPCTLHGCMTPEDVKPSMFWSPVSGRMYRLWNQAGQPSQSSVLSPAELIRRVVEERWGDLPWMFDGAFNCTEEGRMADTQLANVDLEKGVLDLSCISHLPMKRLCNGKCPVETRPCPFKQYCAPSLGAASVHGGVGTQSNTGSPEPDPNAQPPAPVNDTGDGGQKGCRNGGGMAIHGGVGAAAACV